MTKPIPHLYQFQFEAADRLFHMVRAKLQAPTGMGSLEVIAYAAGRLSRTETLLVIAPKVLHAQWHRQLADYGGIQDATRYLIETPQSLLDKDRRRRLHGIDNIILNHVRLGATTTIAVAEVRSVGKILLKDV